MPSIMGVFDALCDSKVSIYETEIPKQNLPKKGSHANNFANLSANVIKILSNVPDEEINKNFSSEDNLHKKVARKSSRSSPEKTINRSTENSEIISPNVQKMLSNLPETELVISTHTEEKKLNSSPVNGNKNESFNGVKVSTSENNIGDRKDTCDVLNSKSDSDLKCSAAGFNNNNNNTNSNSEDVECPRLPLGSYLHTTSTGIASRTPVGRKNLGKYLQVSSNNIYTRKIIPTNFDHINLLKRHILQKCSHSDFQN